MPAVVIAVSGSTRSGKGGCIELIRQELLGPRFEAGEYANCVQRFSSIHGEPRTIVSCVSQDSFFMVEKINAVLNQIFDRPEALDHDKCLQVVLKEATDPAVSVVLLEGFMLFYDERLYGLCNVRLWLEVSKDVAKQRRMKTKRVNAKYFDEHIWPNHKRYTELVFARPQSKEQIGVIDGTQSYKEILAAARTFLPTLGGPSVITALEAAAANRELAVQKPGKVIARCWSPECRHPVNSDPQVSTDFCCDKCEGRYKGEAWAWNGKQKHTACCSSRQPSSAPKILGGGDSAPRAPSGRKCALPGCNYMSNSDPSVSELYCCEKCEGLATGAPWANAGKRHYKSCEKIIFDPAAEASGDTIPKSKADLAQGLGANFAPTSLIPSTVPLMGAAMQGMALASASGSVPCCTGPVLGAALQGMALAGVPSTGPVLGTQMQGVARPGPYAFPPMGMWAMAMGMRPSSPSGFNPFG